LAIWPAVNGRVNGLLWWVFVWGEEIKSVVMGSEWAGRRMARGVGGMRAWQGSLGATARNLCSWALSAEAAGNGNGNYSQGFFLVCGRMGI